MDLGPEEKFSKFFNWTPVQHPFTPSKNRAQMVKQKTPLSAHISLSRYAAAWRT